MIHLDKEQIKLMVAVHGYSGLFLGLLLYAVIFTGMAAVFAEEIGIWSAGHVESQSAFERPIDSAVRRLAAQTPQEFHEDVDLFEIGDHNLGAFFHRHETEPDGDFVSRGVYYQLDADGDVAATLRGTGEEVFGPRNDDALSHFLVDTHVRLHVPDPWGLLLTGILGLAMLVAAVSGLLIHRHLLKDIFTLRRRANPVLADRDRHSVAGSWSLPFAFILAFTGSFFSFFGTIGAPVVAMSAFGGNVEAMNEAVFGNPGKADPSPVPIGNLDLIAADAIRRTGQVPTFIAIEHFGRADAKVSSFHPPASADIEPSTLLYNGATAEFIKTKPAIGAQPSAGGTLVAIMAPLHFGNFAGVLSKALWFALGFAMCYVTITGLRLWLVRRQEDMRSLEWLDRSVTVVAWGLPLGMAAAAAAFLLTMPIGTATYWTPAAFLIAAALAIAAGCGIPRQLLGRTLQLGTGAIMAMLPLLRIIAGGPGWTAAAAAGQPIIAALDLGFFIAGVWLVWRGIRMGARRSVASESSVAVAL